jgi:hypothetical protein
MAAGNGTCTPCDAGQYSLGGEDTICHDCDKGTFSAVNASTCLPCDVGTTTAGNKTGLIEAASKDDICTGKCGLQSWL